MEAILSYPQSDLTQFFRRIVDFSSDARAQKMLRVFRNAGLCRILRNLSVDIRKISSACLMFYYYYGRDRRSMSALACSMMFEFTDLKASGLTSSWVAKIENRDSISVAFACTILQYLPHCAVHLIPTTTSPCSANPNHHPSISLNLMLSWSLVRSTVEYQVNGFPRPVRRPSSTQTTTTSVLVAVCPD